MPLSLWNRAGPAIHVPRGVQRPRWPFSLNRDSPQADGLIAWWPGWAGAGTTLHSYGGLRGSGTALAADGTFNGTIAWNVDPDGLMGNVVEFPGGVGGDRVDIPFFLNPNDGPASICVWGYLRSMPGNNDQNIIFQQEGAGGVKWLGVRNDATKNSVTTAIGGILFEANTDITARTNEWIHYSCTWSSGGSGTMNIYLDGENDGSATRDPQSETSGYRYGAHKVPGMGPGEGESWDGFLCDLRIYNVEVPASVVRAMWSPSSRWDMYYELNRIYYSFPPAAAPPVDVATPAGGIMGLS